jgi:hypothetical protein
MENNFMLTLLGTVRRAVFFSAGIFLSLWMLNLRNSLGRHRRKLVRIVWGLPRKSGTGTEGKQGREKLQLLR